MTKRLVALFALAGLACGGGGRTATPAPADPNAALAAFLVAVKGNNLERMGATWGTERGPAVEWMEPSELNKRLVVIQRYLAHSSSRVVEGPKAVPGRTDQRTFRVELTRQQCVRVLPVDLVRVRSGGWVVSDVHLEQAGRAVGPCADAGTGR